MGKSGSYRAYESRPKSSPFESSLEFQDPFFQHCLQCEVHWPPAARAPRSPVLQINQWEGPHGDALCGTVYPLAAPIIPCCKVLWSSKNLSFKKGSWPPEAKSP